MWPELVSDFGSRPDLIGNAKLGEALSLRDNLILLLPAAKITSNKKNEPLDIFLRPAIPVSEKLIGGPANVTRGKTSIAFALTNLNSLAALTVSEEIDTILCLAPLTVNLTGGDLRLGIKDIATELLEGIFIQFVERWTFPWLNPRQ